MKRKIFSLKDLAFELNKSVNSLAKDFTIQHKKKHYTYFDGVWRQFPTQKEVLIEFDHLNSYMNRLNKTMKSIPNSFDLEDVDSTIKKSPFRLARFCLLGHFNHGKTTLFNALQDFPNDWLLESEHDHITQVGMSSRTHVYGGFAPDS